MVVAVRTFEKSVYSKETAQRCVPEGCHLDTRRRENFKSHAEWEHFVIKSFNKLTFYN
jgi:hypothetical protein